MKTFVIFILLSISYIFTSESVLLKDIDSLKTTDDNYQYVYLIRHGESTFNLPDEKGMYYTQGQSVSASLTKNGKRQALEIAKILQEKIPPNSQVVVTSSTALRASYTALSIFEALSKQGIAQLDDESADLLEIAKGKWEGLPKDGIFNSEFNKWKKLSAYEQWKIPQVSTAESIESTAIRAASAIDKLVQKHSDKTLFIVSHGGALMGIEQLIQHTKFSKDPNSNFPKFKYHNCDMLLLKIPKGKSINEATVEYDIKSGFPNTYK